MVLAGIKCHDLRDGEELGKVREDRISERLLDIEGNSLSPYGANLLLLSRELELSDLIVGFNIKFDLHWIRRYVPSIRFPRVWDCQLCEFILSNQHATYPSLNQSCIDRGLGSKLDVVATQYWANGIDTDCVPENVLKEYLSKDLELTYKLFVAQWNEIRGAQRKLFNLQCKDLLVLQEMEFNGLMFDQSLASQRFSEASSKLQQNEDELNRLVNAPIGLINWDSPRQVSQVVFGGEIKQKVRVPTTRTLKNGTVKQGDKWGTRSYTFPSLYRPDPEWESDGGSGTNKFYSVSDSVLRTLSTRNNGKVRDNIRNGSRVIDALLARRSLAKIAGTYYEGLSNLISERDWPANVLHGSFNQCVAKTGRLTSNGPNLQNLDQRVKELVYSRYED